MPTSPKMIQSVMQPTRMSIEYDQEKYVLNLANLENEEWVLIGVTPEANILSRITPDHHFNP